MLSGPLGRSDGLVRILLGIAVVVLAATRFIRTQRQLDDRENTFSRPRPFLLSVGWRRLWLGGALISRSVDDATAV
jgi:uncharacterized membrane protein YidH (DUF202 family)